MSFLIYELCSCFIFCLLVTGLLLSVGENLAVIRCLKGEFLFFFFGNFHKMKRAFFKKF